MVAQFLAFKEPPHPSPLAVVLVCIPTNSVDSLFAVPSPHSLFADFVDAGHSDRCDVIPCSFALHFSDG